MEALQNLLQQVLRMQWSDYLDIAVVAFLIYRLLPLVRTPSTIRVARAVIVVVIIAALTDVMHLYTLSFIINQFLSIGLLALVVLFQPELRRMLDHLGSVRLGALFGGVKPVAEMDMVISQTVAACDCMSREKVGALIVFTRETSLEDYVKTGTTIDGQVSEQLIRNIFFPKAALHDGAMIIREGKIKAAGCVLPLSTSDRLAADLGTRHRAGVGMSENSDAVVVIVSEETGTISVAMGGMLKRHLAPKTLEKLLHNALCPDENQEEERRTRTMKRKIGSVLLSLACAFGLWLYVITTVSPGSTDTYYNIPIVWEGESVLNENGLMVTAVSSNTVNLRLSGNRSDLSKVNSANITIKADLSKIREPGTQIPITYTSPTFPGDVASNAFVIESKEPDTIYVTVVKRISKTVPVEVTWVGTTAEGFMIDRENKTLDYPEVTVTGPESVVNTIDRATITVDLDGRRESISESYTYTLCDKNGDPVDARLITTDVEEVRLDVSIRRVKDLRLTYNLIPGGGADADNTTVQLSAETIRVSGSEAALENLGDTLSIGTINLADITKNTSVTFGISLPDGITNLTGVTEVTADISFHGLSIKELTVTDIQSINIPEGLSVELITEKLTVTLRGPTGLISKVTPEDLLVTVDFTGAEVGTSTFRATVSLSGEYSALGTVKTEPVSAKIDAE